MCISFFYIDRNPDSKIKFLIVHNREEDFGRPTLKISQFEDDTNIFGGRDLREKGTWLGFNARTQNFAFLTNRFSVDHMRTRIFNLIKSKVGIQYTDTKISRGKIISEFLSTDFKEKYQIGVGESSTSKFGYNVFTNWGKFNPFNLLLCNFKEMEFIFQGNFDKFPPVSLRDGFHSICNYSSFEKQLPKQTFGLNRFQSIVDQQIKDLSENITPEVQKIKEDELVTNIHELMENQEKRFSPIFLPTLRESSIFIKPFYSPIFGYYRGTRTSTVVLLNDKNELTFSENTYFQDEKPKENTKLFIQL